MAARSSPRRSFPHLKAIQNPLRRGGSSGSARLASRNSPRKRFPHAKMVRNPCRPGVRIHRFSYKGSCTRERRSTVFYKGSWHRERRLILVPGIVASGASAHRSFARTRGLGSADPPFFYEGSWPRERGPISSSRWIVALGSADPSPFCEGS